MEFPANQPVPQERTIRLERQETVEGLLELATELGFIESGRMRRLRVEEADLERARVEYGELSTEQWEAASDPELARYGIDLSSIAFILSRNSGSAADAASLLDGILEQEEYAPVLSPEQYGRLETLRSGLLG